MGRCRRRVEGKGSNGRREGKKGVTEAMKMVSHRRRIKGKDK